MNKGKRTEVALTRADGKQWERVVFAEVLIPEVANVFGDYWSYEAVKHAAYLFMKNGFGIDVEHDNVNVIEEGVYVVESFIVRPGDPDFILGAWVIGMKIEPDDLWQRVLDNELNGFSYEATVNFLQAVLQTEDDGTRIGYTEPDLLDGHRHAFMVLVDDTGRPLYGGTDEVDGHSHTITVHTVTDESDGHSHRFNLVTGKAAT